MLRRRFLFPGLMIAAIAAAAGCGGGGANPFVSPAPTATPVPHSGPTTIPVGPTPQVVSLSGGGYTLTFTVPTETTGTTATMSAVLQTSLPSGVNAPQAKSARHMVPVKPLATTYGGLAYLVVSTTATVGFSAAPSFVFTLPAGTTIGPGQYAYLLFWDPYIGTINGWVNLLGPGTVSGQTVTFPGVATGVHLNANAQYVYALAVTSSAQPTATPAPTPTPTVAPSGSPGAVPAYCSAYATPSANANSSPQPVYFTDNSGTGAQAYFYVVTGSPPGTTSTQTQYLAANGTLMNFTNGATAPPIPVACFPGSTHNGNGLTFELPPPTNANQSGNLYIVYATPGPGNTLPNPLSFVGTGSGGGHSAPTLDWNAAGYSSLPWDVVEYTLPYGVTDVTQVDKVGLPLQLTQGTATVGFASGQYDSLLSAIQADPTYATLAVSGQLNGRNVLARILAPQDADNWGFPQDWWYNSTFNPNNSALSEGYLGKVLQSYQTAPQLYTLSGIQGVSGNYCASFDGSANVLWYSVGSATNCSSLPASATYTMPVNTTLSGSLNGAGQPNTDSYGVCASGSMSMPYGGPGGGSPLVDLTEFYLWKGFAIEVGRGVALQNVTHPVGTWNTAPSSPLPFSSYYLDPVYNKYAFLVHKYMIGNRSYALQYDEPGGLAPTITSNPAVPLQITVWNIPAFSRATPTAVATPLPCP